MACSAPGQAKVRLTLKEEEVDPLAGLTDEPKAKPAPQREKVQPKQEAKVDAPKPEAKPIPKAVPAQERKPEPKQEAPKAETVKAKPAPKQDKPKAKPAPRQDKGAEAEKPKAKPAPKAPVQPLEKPEVTMNSRRCGGGGQRAWPGPGLPQGTDTPDGRGS